MAEVSQRTWRIPGQRGRRKAWGFTLQVPCQPCPHKRKTGNGPVHPDGVRQEKHYRAEWTREDAEEALAKKLLQIEPVKPKTAGITFGEATERYLAAKTRKRSLRDDTRILGHLVGYFGKETPLADITASRISAYKGHRLKTTRKIGDEERPLSIATVNRTLAILRHLLRLAHDEWEVLDTAPRIRMEREPEGRLRWLTPEDAARLLEACRESRNDGLVDLVEFALFTGMRRGEALGLTWDRVDRARGVVQLEETKSGKRREVPLNSRADAVLARRGSKSTGLVFGTRNWDHFRSAWERAVERAKLADFHFHDLRHSFASWAIQRGATLQEVKDLLGHSSLAMTLRYGHLAPEHLRSAVARLDAALPVTASAQISAHEPAREVELLQK
jgi:integrase